jgi:diguanylate cyclase (GGDEF)-like protein/PAS domain S-box-containing protein
LDQLVPQTVLTIDDCSLTYDLIKARLRSEQVQLLYADGGNAGLAMARQHRPDLILLDIDMPAPNGYEVCRALKSDPVTRDIPVVFLTGFSSAEEKLKGLELGAIDYITKPFDPAELRARVRAALQTKQLVDLLNEKAAVLRMNEERFRFLAENSSDIISRHTLDGRFVYVSPACETILGYEPAALRDRPVTKIIHPEDVARLSGLIRQLTDGAAASSIATFRALRKDGQYVWLESTARLVGGADGTPGGARELHISSRDVTERKRSENFEQARAQVLELIAENHPLAEVLNRLIALVEQEYPGSAASIVLLSEGRLDHVAPSLPAEFRAALDGQLLRLTSGICSDAASSGATMTCSELATDEHWAGIRDAAREHGLVACWSVIVHSSTGDVVGMFNIFLRTPLDLDAAGRRLLEMVGRLITIATEHQELTYQLAYRAHHDSLTGLPNRLLFEDRLNQAIARANEQGHLVALLCLDLDRFKVVNDTLGHHAGDLLLAQFTRRIQSILRPTDTLARMGGDEFTLILPELTAAHDAEQVAQRLLDLLRLPFEIAGQELFVTGSVGISICPEDGREWSSLQKNADLAMYRAKSLGRNRFQRFTSDMLSDTSERLVFESIFRRAVERKELELYYQPQYDINNQLIGLEALMRWNSPQLGFVPPSRFVPVAEETGLIVPLGEWVIDEACRQSKAWGAAGHLPVKIAVNVSALQFTQPNFAAIVSAALARHGIDPHLIELEITESLLMSNTLEAAAKLNQLREIGVGVALDDFGTGYSSLAYLQRLPIDLLKIDRSFVKDIDAPNGADNSLPVIRAIISLGHALNKQVLAEGVETQRQRDLLASLGCDGIQGYFLGKPMPANKVPDILPKSHAAIAA